MGENPRSFPTRRATLGEDRHRWEGARSFLRSQRIYTPIHMSLQDCALKAEKDLSSLRICSLEVGSQILTTPYSFMRAVTLSGNWGPLCSSPATTGKINPDFNVLISCPVSGRENSNCRMSVTKNACISATLLTESSRSIRNRLRLTVESSLETHARRHPIQAL